MGTNPGRTSRDGRITRPAARAAALTATLAIAAAPATSLARAQVTFAYPRDVVWNTAVRLLRVDLRYVISEQDPDNGYILFEFVENERSYFGSVEFVEGAGEGGMTTIDVTLSVGGMPESAEHNILRKLKNKLREDYGLPPRPPALGRPPAPETVPQPVENTDAENGNTSAEMWLSTHAAGAPILP